MNTATATKPETTTATQKEEFNTARYNELMSRFAKFLLTEQEEKELDKMRKVKKEEMKGRITALQQAIKLIFENSLTLSELVDMNAFTKEDIKAEADAYFPSFGRVVKTTSTGEKATRVPKDYGMKIFEFKKDGARGKPTTVAVDTPFPADSLEMGANFKFIQEMKGDIATNLKSKAINDPKVKEFLDSEKGHEFVTKWAGWISRGGKSA